MVPFIIEQENTKISGPNVWRGSLATRKETKKENLVNSETLRVTNENKGRVFEKSSNIKQTYS